MKMRPPPAPTHREIAEAAYFLWLEAGRPEGRALEHWLRAEWQLQWRRVRPPFVARAEGSHLLTRHAR